MFFSCNEIFVQHINYTNLLLIVINESNVNCINESNIITRYPELYEINYDSSLECLKSKNPYYRYDSPSRPQCYNKEEANVCIFRSFILKGSIKRFQMGTFSQKILLKIFHSILNI